ncbi:MAG TPA: carbohydrate ABC transporter permease, partial [Phycisphaerae bacterium]|nr:carbohydrate ABC transporter permease [Phycisphaerae bacterium]
MRKLSRAILTFYLPLALVGLPMLFPLYWLVISALKSPGEDFSIPPTWFPRQPTLHAFRAIFSGQNAAFAQALVTSLMVAGATALLAVMVAICGGYALARLQFRLRHLGGLALLFTQLFPVAAILIPLYLFWARIGLHGSCVALIITYLAQAVPVTTWLMKGYIETIPVEMEQQAWIDGANRFQALVYVLLPLIGPAVGATAILAFVGAWNEFVFALALTGTDLRTKTLPVAMV